MKRIILTTMAFTFSASLFAEQPTTSADLQGAPDTLAMTSIETKNRNIMSSYYHYSQLRQQTHSVNKMRVKQQYNDYIEQKSVFTSTAGL